MPEKRRPPLIRFRSLRAAAPPFPAFCKKHSIWSRRKALATARPNSGNAFRKGLRPREIPFRTQAQNIHGAHAKTCMQGPESRWRLKSRPQPCDPDINLAQAAKAVGNVSSRNFAQHSSAVSANSIGAQQLQSMFLQRGVRVETTFNAIVSQGLGSRVHRGPNP